VLGCQALVHIPQEKRAKHDSKTKECIYLGSSRDEFGYRLWDPANRKIIRSRDNVFSEDQTLEDAKQEQPKLKVIRSSNLDLSPITPGNLGDDSVKENFKAGTNEDHVSSSNNDESEDLGEFDLEYAKSEVQGKPQLRRSTRER